MVAYGGIGFCKKELTCNLGDGNTLNSCDSCLRWQVALNMAYTCRTQRPNTICPAECNPCICSSRATACFVSILEPLLPLHFITAILTTFDRFCVHWDGNLASDWGHEKKKWALKGRWQGQQKEIYCEQAGRGCHGTGASHSHLLSTYPHSHQSAGPLEHLSPVAFLRPVKPSHFTDDRLMRLHGLRPPHMQGPGRIETGCRRGCGQRIKGQTHVENGGLRRREKCKGLQVPNFSNLPKTWSAKEV